MAESSKIKIGLIINPIAGMGGRVGLKGTDGIADQARTLGARPRSGQKAARALAKLPENTHIIAAPGPMGEDCARQSGFISPRVTDIGIKGKTKASDTIQAAKTMVKQGAGLILFAGGDGTARDIYTAVGDTIAVLGIPAGVKIHSPVFAMSPEKAGALATLYLTQKTTRFMEKEVLDIDENAYRKGSVSTQLFRYLKVPDDRRYLQNRKAGTPLSQKASQNLISLDIIDRMHKDMIYLIGPGTTTKLVLDNLGINGSLLGVDIVRDKKLIKKDAAEADILAITANNPFVIIITPIGGQGYLFGRGNHQFSPQVIQKAGPKNILVMATLEKIGSLKGSPFLVDTGDPKIDTLLSGYIRVITGYRQEMVCKIL